MPVPTKRSNPLDMAPAPIAAELQAQLQTRAGRRKAAQPKRPKATYDLSEPQQRLVAQMAQAEGVSLTDIVALAVVRLAADLEAGLDLTPLKRPARSLKA
jgi:hypothetical protein